jgi:hypothetical protein
MSSEPEEAEPAAPKPYESYLRTRQAELRSHPRYAEFVELFILARRWEQPDFYGAEQQNLDRHRLLSSTASHYWMDICLRAFVLAEQSPAERQATVKAAYEAEQAAKAAAALYAKAGADALAAGKRKSWQKITSLDQLDIQL